ncbi:MAG: HEAT repeat domain-containing protein [Kiritimatiellaeota bacterium]|nr:HEAT repeat domain-containing protein [Kiritimatiellota bacterium]
MTALFRLGDYSRLAEGVEFLQGAPESDQAVVHAKALLSNQMGYVTNTELIAKNYIPLLQHTNDFIRQNAIYAFRKARLHMAVPYLIKGLQDSNQDIRYQCLMGLSETLRRTAGWATSKGEFMNNEREYIGRWQAWWESSGRNEFMAPTEPKN